MSNDYVFINLESRNTTSNNAIVSMVQERNPYILERTGNYLVAVDRFAVHRCILPIYEDNDTLTIKMVRKSDLVEKTADLDFSSVVDTNNMLWSYSTFFNVFKVAMADVVSQFSLPETEVPYLSINLSTNIVSLVYDEGLAWATDYVNDYIIYFNNPLRAMFPFDYSSLQFEQDWYDPSVVDGANSITTFEEHSMNPIQTIIIEASGLPVIYEYTTNENSIVSENSVPILTDFEVSSQVYHPINNITYSATTGGMYRFHSMEDVRLFKKLTLNYKYRTISGKIFDLYVIPTGGCSTKLVFKRI